MKQKVFLITLLCCCLISTINVLAVSLTPQQLSAHKSPVEAKKPVRDSAFVASRNKAAAATTIGMTDATTLTKGRLQVYQWIQDYNTFGHARGKQGYDEFVRLFKDTSVVIVNDYLPSIYEAGYSLSVNDYLGYVLQEDPFYDMYYTISNASIVSESTLFGMLVFNVELTKTMEFLEKHNDDDATMYEYPPYDIPLNIKLIYDPVRDRAYAVEVTTMMPADPVYVVHSEDGVQAYNEYMGLEEAIKYDHSNKNHSSYVPIYEDPQMLLYYYDERKNALFLGIGAGYSITSLALRDNNLLDNVSNGGGISYNANIGYYREFWRGAKGSKIGMEFGAEGFRRSIQLKDVAWHQALRAVDPDGDTYERQVQVKKYKETLEKYSIGLSIALRYDYAFNSLVGIFARAGAIGTYDLALGSKMKCGSASYAGKYPYLDDVVIDEGLYDFGTSENISKPVFVSDAMLKWGAEAFGGIGVQIHLSEAWTVDIAAEYHYLFLSKFKNDISIGNGGLRDVFQDHSLTVGRYLNTDKDTWYSLFNVGKKVKLHDIGLKVQFTWHF